MSVKVVKEYEGVPASVARRVKKFAGLDTNYQPIFEEFDVVPCPDCGESLKVLQHATVADGLPYVNCGCGKGLMVVDKDE